jgi:hypothetical protein
VVYFCGWPRAQGGAQMTFIVIAMLLMIIASIILELILPTALKRVLAWTNIIAPMLT